MSGSLRFVAGRTLVGLDAITVDGRAVVEAGDALHRVLRERCGETAATLFAEPVVSRGNGSAPARVDWYTRLEGEIRPLAELDPERADALRGRVRAALATMEPALRDLGDGPLVAHCLHLASPNAVLAVGDAPLLIDWGLLPRGLREDERARARHGADVLGGMLPERFPAPPVGRDEWTARYASVGAPVAERAAAPPRVGQHARAVTAALVAAATAGILLALSFVPGVLIFPSAPRAASSEARAVQTAWLDGLRRRATRLAGGSARMGRLPARGCGRTCPHSFPRVPRACGCCRATARRRGRGPRSERTGRRPRTQR